MIVIHSNFMSALHGFQDNEVLLPTGYDLIVSPPPVGAARTFSWKILKERPWLPDIVSRIWRHRDFSARGSFRLCYRRILKERPWLPDSVQSTCWEGTSLRQTASFEQLCVKLSLSVWPVPVRKKKWKEGKKEEVTRSVYFTYSGRIPTKLSKCVRLTDVIKRSQFYRYISRGFGAVRCWSFHVAIRNPGRP